MDPHAMMMDNGEHVLTLVDPVTFPFLATDFFDEGEEFVHVSPPYNHYDSEPVECAYCLAKAEKIKELEHELEELEHDYYSS